MKKSQLIFLIGIGLLLASIGNGAVSYLKRVGQLERQKYEYFMTTYCGLSDGSPGGYRRPCLCLRDTAANQDNAEIPAAEESLDPEYIYQSNGYERFFKIVKDLLFGGFMVLSLYFIGNKRARLPGFADAWPAWVLALNVGFGLAISMALWGGAFAVVGLRPFAFLAIVLLGSWVVGGAHWFARCAGWLLVIEAILVVIEVFFGIPLRPCPREFRAAGTMVLPNSLGIFAVIVLAFHVSLSQKPKPFLLLLVATMILIVASRSGTGLVALFALLGFIFIRRIKGAGKIVAGGVFLLLAITLMLQLPTLTDRPAIYDSLFEKEGRIGIFMGVVQESSATEILVGRGVGFGTNAATNLLAGSSTPSPQSGDPSGVFHADSMITVLLTQLGVLGIATFFGLLGWAFWRDPEARPAYLVIAISSLTINITELFPANFILGILLARSIAISRHRLAKVAGS